MLSATYDCSIDMSQSISQLTLDFLTWLAAKPRTYAETMDAWRTSCPRLTVWEDALGGGLIHVNAGRTRCEARVILTDRGIAMLQASTSPSRMA